MTRGVDPTPAPMRVQPHWRPSYHITGERNWINDPNGPVHWDGVYHLFFQANPEAPHWGPPRWGHVSSTDLTHWERHREALSPDNDGPDADGCWSGCLRDIDGQPAIYYTGVVGDDHDRVESVCRAWGNHDLTVWTKDTANPLIAHSPPGRDTGYHRDPFIWQDNGRWHMLLGSGTAGADRHGQVLRYESPDGTSWQYAGVFFEAPRRFDGLDLGEHWECPQLVFDQNKAVLILSCQVPDTAKPLLHAVYFIGQIHEGTFHGDLRGVLDQGDVLYAPAVTVDGSGRTLLWGWTQERLPTHLHQHLSHVGALSLPRVLSVAGGQLHVTPAPETLLLRQHTVEPGASGDCQHVDTCCLEVTFTATGSRGSAQWCASSSQDCVSVDIDLDSRELTLTVIDQITGRHTFHIQTPPEAIDVQLFIDGSLVELFVAGHAISTRFYPADAQLDTFHTASDGDAAIHSIDIWHLSPDVVSEQIPAPVTRP